ncbi:MAG: MFS transporter [Candidatus Limnocylindria bacterium]
MVLLTLLPSTVPVAALPLLQREWGASGAEAGWLVAGLQIGYAAAVLAVVPLTDRISSMRIMMGATILAVGGNVLFAMLAHDPWSGAALRAMIGFGLGGIYIPGVRMVSASVPPARRGSAISLYHSATVLGNATGLFAAGALLPLVDWRGAALVLGLASGAAIPLAVTGIRGAPASALGSSGRLHPAVLRDPGVARTVSAYAGHTWELFGVRAWMPALFAAALMLQGVDATEAAADAGRWVAFMVLLGLPAVLVAGWLSDRLGRPRVAASVAMGSICVSLALGFLLQAPWPVLVIAGSLAGMLMAADSAIYTVVVTETAAPARVGSALALQSFAGFIASSASPVVIGAALDLFSWPGAFAVGGLGALALILPFALAAVGRERHAEAFRAGSR